MMSDFQVGKQVGQAASDFTMQAYVVKYLIRVGRQVGQQYLKNICECSLILCVPNSNPDPKKNILDVDIKEFVEIIAE